ncbi:MAG: DUF3179 domain-containing protein [Phycisphaerae bacterium]|nr:DUF3179 domain-containing protein [Phycisphaerae bacterium]MDW8261568.1 DUF3179 domain-containing (seleno)protein [Phycisphaerales bacterium]
MVPLLLIFGAISAAAALAFSREPILLALSEGTAIIRFLHRAQSLLLLTSLAGGLGLVGLVVAGRRKAWWLLGLIPIVGLLGWGFVLAPARLGKVDDQPKFVRSSQADWLEGSAWVLGVVSDGHAMAFPLTALHRTPVVVVTERDRRLIVIFSPSSGVASACVVDRLIRGRDLRIVAELHGVLFLFHARLGEFFDGLTLRQPGGGAITGFGQRLPASLTRWGTWKQQHPGTFVLLQPDAAFARERSFPSDQDSVVYLETDPPIVVPTRDIQTEPVNVFRGTSAALVCREGGFGRVVAFDRRIDQDLFPRFVFNRERGRRNAPLLDEDTGSGWTFTGECVEGPMKGTRLRPLIVVENVPRDAASFWIR